MPNVRENGVNMLAVKKQNRSSILQLIHLSGSISRKEIALRLGLTPAAITMITGEMLDEGLLCQVEAEREKSTNRKGRREVLLQINGTHYAALGVYITRHKFRVLCTDLNNTILFEDLIYTGDCRRKAPAILEKLTHTIQAKLAEYNVLSTRTMVGLGVSINGIVDSINGISVNPFQVWEERNIPVASILSEKLRMPVLLTNNICALAHGESVLSSHRQIHPMLFIKYGPGLGAAYTLGDGQSSVFNYRAIQLGHMIADPNGAPCVCGNQGCLETIIHYDSIENTMKSMLSEQRTPVLWDLTGGDASKVTIQEVIRAYNAEDHVVEQTLDRVIFYLCLVIKNMLTLFDPESVVLYGELFENERFRQSLQQQLTRYANTERVSFSHYNMGLETLGPAATVESLFFENGGLLNIEEKEI